jgi:putative ABC transport system permease protein
MTKLLFVKLLHDVWITWGRVMMMVVAISLSLIMFSAMLYARTLVASQMTSGYSSTNPASARITISPGVAPDQIEALRIVARAEPGVIDATMRSVLTVQIQGEHGEQTPLRLYTATPSDPMRIATFKVEQGNWPPPKDSVLLERTTLQFLNLKVGESIVVTDFDGKPTQLKITGVVHDQSLSPAGQGQQGDGYVSTNSLPYLGKPPVLNQLVFTVADQAGQTEPGHNRDTIVRTALHLADRLKAMRGVGIEQVAVPPPYEHPHQVQADTLLTALLGFGALSLLLSAILIATMFNGLLTQQIPQIGMMKAIGAHTGRILQLYAMMVLLVAAAATALALIPGIVLGRALAQMILAGSLNMDITSLVVPWWTYGVVIAAGIMVPLLISLIPLLWASHRTVREALDERGVDHQGAPATRFFIWLSKLRGMNRTLLMAFRNMFRRRTRFWLSVGLLATAGAIFIGGLNTMAGFQALPKTITEEHRWDVEVRLSTPASEGELTKRVERVPGVTRIETWNTVLTGVESPGKINVTRAYPDGHATMGLTAIPSSTSMLNPPPVLEGRWLHTDETGAIVLPQTIRKTFPEVNVGSDIQLPIEGQPTNWRVVGIVKELTAPACPCVTQTGFGQATGRPNEANLVRIITDRHDPQTRIAVGQAVTQTLRDARIKAQDARSIDALLGSTEGHSALLIVLILLIALAIGTVGLIGLGSTMSTNVIERTREFGVMSAIGASASTVRRLVVFEGLSIALVSCVVAAVPALVLTVVMGMGLGNLFLGAPLPLQVSVLAILVWVVIVLIGASLATLAPAYRASRLTVREALAYL